MERTWKPTTGGILCIIAGVIIVLGGLVAIVGIAAIGLLGLEMELPLPLAEMPWLSVLGVPIVILGIISIIGGVYALKRRLWGLAMAGAILVTITGNLLYGTLAIIFISLGKGEFE
ncbi:MAG: hypothetical protein ACNA7X_02345 [Dehalococcoidia bacterium]